MAADLASLQAALAGESSVDTEGNAVTVGQGTGVWNDAAGDPWNIMAGRAYNFSNSGRRITPETAALFQQAGLTPQSGAQNRSALDPDSPENNSNGSFGEALGMAARFAALAYGAGNFDPSSFGFNSGSGAPLDISGGLDSSTFNAPLAPTGGEGLNFDQLLQNQRPQIGPFSPPMSVPAQLGENASFPMQTGGGTLPLMPSADLSSPSIPGSPENGLPETQAPAPVENGVSKPLSFMQMIQNGSSPSALLAQLSSASSPLAPLLSQAGGAGAMPWGSPGNILSIGSGLYGLYQSNKLKQLAQLAASRADPWGQSGGRDLASGQLQNLLKDPSSITSTPGYAAGLQAVERRMAAQGFNGSGNMMAALSKYGGDFYNNALSQLGALSGANANPATAQSLMLQGNIGANELASRSLASLGYGTIRAGLS